MPAYAGAGFLGEKALFGWLSILKSGSISKHICGTVRYLNAPSFLFSLLLKRGKGPRSEAENPPEAIEWKIL